VLTAPGIDTADYSLRTNDVTASIDVCNDGEVGEGDRIQTDVENLTGGAATTC